MPKRKTIERYNLQTRVLALSASGKSDREIAQILTREDLAGMNAISQSSISRWLKGIRAERSVTAKGIVDDYLKESIPADLKLLDELVQFHLVIFRGKTTILETDDGKKVKAASITLDTRRTASRDLHSILQTKMRFIGVDADPENSANADPVDLSKYVRTNTGEYSQTQKEQGGIV